MAILNTSLSMTPTSIVTSTGDTGITTAYICNYGENTVMAFVWAVPQGGSANDGTIIYKAVPISANDTLVVDTEKLILADGDALYANVSADSSATATVSTMAI
jgi:hypothetical protein